MIFAGRIETTSFKNKFVTRVSLLIGGFDMPFATSSLACGASVAQGYSTTGITSKS